MQRRAALARRTRLARGQLRRVIRLRPGYSGARRLVWLRAHGLCELCGRRVPPDTFDAHHRQTRALGVDCSCNLLCLCGSCHTVGPEAIHDSPTLSQLHGRMISRYDSRDHFHEVPVLLRPDLGWVKLRCDGSLEALDERPPHD